MRSARHAACCRQLHLPELIRAVRRELRVPAKDIDDKMVALLLKELDKDKSGAVEIHELVHFLQNGPASLGKDHEQVCKGS